MSDERTLPLRPGAWRTLLRIEPWALPTALFFISLCVYLYGIGWGLPNGNDTWANDAIAPGAPLSILYRLLIGDPWNSGWFWFKYPLGHVLILGTVYAPYMAWLFLSGGISDPTSEYPYGMAEPEETLATLAMLCRFVSAAMGAGTVAVVYACVRPYFGILAGTCSALATAFCYPFVYYAHTSNVEVPYVFWLLLAFLAAVRLSQDSEEAASKRWWIVLGAAAAMSFSTKELGAGFFIGLPPFIMLGAMVSGARLADIVRGGLFAGIAAAVTVGLANLAFLNPSGFMNRVGFLTQTLPADVALQYAPYYFPIDLGSTRDFASEVAQLELALSRMFESLGTPTTVLAILGAVVALVKRPTWGLLGLAAAATFYLFGARAMLSLSMRYVLPAVVIATVFAGVGLAAIVEGARLKPVRIALGAAALAWIVAYGLDVNRMLAGDARYQAEAWLAERAAEGQSIEVYQRPTYLPRAPEGVTITRVGFSDRGPAALAERAPDYVILSSSGISGVTVEYKKDWKEDGYYNTDEWIPSQVATDGTVMNYKRRENVELLEGLQAGTLGYRKAAEFVLVPWIERPLIQSLNPQVTIYERDTAVGKRQNTTGDAAG